MVSICGFGLHFPNESWCWPSFRVLLGLWRAIGRFICLSCSFLIERLPFYYWVLIVLYLFSMEVPYQIFDLQKFSPILDYLCTFLSSWCPLKCPKVTFWWCPVYFFSCCLCFWCHIHEIIAKSLLNCFCAFAWTCFWVLCSIPLVYVAMPLPTPLSLCC